MTFWDLTPEEGLALCYALSVAIYKSYILNKVNYIANFIEALGENLEYLVAAKQFEQQLEANSKRNNVEDEEDFHERLKVLEELILSFNR